jgi:hypothetical protein
MSDIGIFPGALCATMLPAATENAAPSIPLPADFSKVRRVNTGSSQGFWLR